MYTFTEDCRIGVRELDEEHEKLFGLIAAADRSLREGTDPVADAMLLLNELRHYAASHFAHEEAYMERIQDPELEVQKKEHAAFTAKINAVRFTDVTDTAAAKTLLLELLEYLSKWLMGHILGSDLMIGQFEKKERMEIPIFDDSFRTGISLIDEEHKTLFEIIGKIYRTIQTEFVHDKYDAIMDILGELKEYTRIHFADEENYMRSIGYSGLARQELLHQNFVDKQIPLR